MGIKLLWVGLTFLLALPSFFKLLGVGASSTFELAGAILMIIGLVMFLLDK